MRVVIFLTLMVLCFSVQAQSNYWKKVDESDLNFESATKAVHANKFSAWRVSLQEVSEVLTAMGRGSIDLEMPLPDGTTSTFVISKNQVLHPALAAKYPEIATYTGYDKDNPARRIYMDKTVYGLHAMMLGDGSTVFVDPYYLDRTDYYTSYYKRDFDRAATAVEGWSCGFENPEEKYMHTEDKTKRWTDDQLKQSNKKMALVTKQYRLAVTTTGEYTALFGGTVAGGLSAVATAINRVSGIYESEVGVILTLIASNDQIIFTNPSTDPFTNSGGDLNRVQSVIDSRIGNANYDVGHIFTSSSGGVASLGVVCTNGAKARGLTGLPNPTGDPFYVDFVAHELGHQFDGLHTFNGDSGNCAGGNRSGSAAYEPGSGATIMAYAGICGDDNLQNNSDAYFHLKSLMEITDLTNGSASCYTSIDRGNNAPVADANAANINGKVIPANTPFELRGDGSDQDNDNLSYQWDEWDLGPQQDVNQGDNGQSPIFRSFFASRQKARVFPRLDDILNGTSTIGMTLPTTNRTLNFQFIVRDNRGGWDSDEISISVDNSAGPFRVTSQSTSATIKGTTTITWDVAGTDGGDVNCPNVNIHASLDGGATFPMLLASNVTNDGRHAVVVPDMFASNVRIRVKCSDNIFFDINDADLMIIPENVDCNTTMTITDDPISDGVYSSDNVLTSTGRVPSEGRVLFIGTRTIMLDPKFQVDRTGYFEAQIYPCED